LRVGKEAFGAQSAAGEGTPEKKKKIADFFEKTVDKTGCVGYNNKALFECSK